jgi:hypothetical protein
MSSLAETLTVPEGEGELGRVARVAALRSALAPDVRVSIAGARPGSPNADGLAGRDAVLALVGRWSPPAGGVDIDFVDVQVTLGEDGANDRFCEDRWHLADHVRASGGNARAMRQLRMIIEAS